MGYEVPGGTPGTATNLVPTFCLSREKRVAAVSQFPCQQVNRHSAATDSSGAISRAEADRVARAAGIVGSVTLLSRISGFARDVVIAGIFGAEMAADSFFVAFGIPNLLRRLFGEGALSAAFIPVFTERLRTDEPGDAKELADQTFTALAGVLTVVSIVGSAAAPVLVWVLVPGFREIPGKIELTTYLTRLVFPYILLIGLATLASSTLNSLGRFAIPAFTPVLLNLSMIVCTLLLAPRLSRPAVALAVGVLAGGTAQWLLQLPELKRKGMLPRLRRRLKHPALARVARLMLPALIGMGVTQVNVLVDRWLASFLSQGSVSYLYYGNRLAQFPLGVIGVAMGIAILPTMSTQAARGSLEEMRGTMVFGIRLVLFLMIPATVGLIVLRIPIVNVLFERGEFTSLATLATARALFYYAFGLVAFAGVRVVVSAFHSRQDTRTPLQIAIVAMVLNIFLNIILMVPLQHAGLALATSISAAANLALLLYVLRQRLGPLGGAQVLEAALRFLGAAAIMGVVCGLVVAHVFRVDASFASRAGTLVWCAALGLVIYLALAHVLKVEEMGYLLRLLRERRAGGSR